jgi:hypothetical protein
MSRTTIAFEEDLLRRLKARAAREGTTLSGLVNALVRMALGRPSRSKYRFQPTLGRGRLRPGVVIEDRDALFDVMGERDERDRG